MNDVTINICLQFSEVLICPDDINLLFNGKTVNNIIKNDKENHPNLFSSVVLLTNCY